MTEVPITQKPVKSMDLFLYDRGIRHERGNNLIKSAPIEKDNQAFAG